MHVCRARYPHSLRSSQPFLVAVFSGPRTHRRHCRCAVRGTWDLGQGFRSGRQMVCRWPATCRVVQGVVPCYRLKVPRASSGCRTRDSLMEASRPSLWRDEKRARVLGLELQAARPEKRPGVRHIAHTSVHGYCSGIVGCPSCFLERVSVTAATPF
jgi:hypothetical protein